MKLSEWDSKEGENYLIGDINVEFLNFIDVNVIYLKILNTVRHFLNSY